MLKFSKKISLNKNFFNLQKSFPKINQRLFCKSNEWAGLNDNSVYERQSENTLLDILSVVENTLDDNKIQYKDIDLFVIKKKNHFLSNNKIFTKKYSKVF